MSQAAGNSGPRPGPGTEGPAQEPATAEQAAQLTDQAARIAEQAARIAELEDLRLRALEVTDRLVAVTDPYQGHRRMTLSYPALARAEEILWLVTGASKHDALARLLAGDQSIPAARVQARRSVIFADAPAVHGPQPTFQGAIFDVDGVLVDSPHYRAWREALQELMDTEWADLRGRTSYSP